MESLGAYWSIYGGNMEYCIGGILEYPWRKYGGNMEDLLVYIILLLIFAM
jgi:hypothetical protein